MARHSAPPPLQSMIRPIRRAMTRVLIGALATTSPAVSAATIVEYVHPEPAQQQHRQTLSGSVVTADSANLSPAVAGLVREVAVDAGDPVTAGQRLLKLDTELAELALAQAEAAAQAVAIQLKEARRLRDEGEPLARRGDLSRSLQDARVADFERLSAELQRLRAVRDERQAVLARHQLKAPYSGTVVARLTAPGEWINPGTPVLRLVGSESAQVHVRLAQPLNQQVRDGDKAQLHLPGHAQPIQARVARVSQAIDPASRTALARLLPEDPNAPLIPGQAVRVDLFPSQSQDALSIPNDAVLRYPDGSRVVWVLEGSDAGTVARRRRLELGNAAAEDVLVLQGLSLEDRVVVRGNEALKDGQTVQAVRFDAAARKAAAR